MTATAHQLRRRRAAAETIIARLASARLRKKFIETSPLACATDADDLSAAIASYTDYAALLALAEGIGRLKRRPTRPRVTQQDK